MKTKSLFLISLLACFVACAPEGGVHVHDTPTGKIIGTLVVTDGSYDVVDTDSVFYDYVGNNIEAELTRLTSDTTKYNIILYKVCFSNHMPVSIDMTIPAVDIDNRGNIAGDSIVPYAGAFGEYPRYTIRNLSGKVVFDAEGKAGALTLQMNCGRYPTSYEGLYVQYNQ